MGTVVRPIGYGKGDHSSYISVSDDGKGVRQEELDKIFEPYYSTKKLGIGLGLTITKRLVDEHGGTIAMESDPGKRTVVTITVPYHEG